MGLKQEDHEFKVNLSYFGHLRVGLGDSRPYFKRRETVESVCSMQRGEPEFISRFRTFNTQVHTRAGSCRRGLSIQGADIFLHH